jgi:murein DD-endopeptidase MepM/ murein hydrolase activator NlpD
MRTTVTLALAIAVLSLGAGAAFAGTYVPRSGGSVGAPAQPRLSDVSCAAKCAGIHKATAGSTVVATGRHLKDVTKVLFTAKSGRRVRAKPISTSKRSVKARVPQGADSGKPRVIDAFKNSATSPERLAIVDHLPPAGSFKLHEASATPRKTYFDGRAKPHLNYIFSADGATDVRVRIIRQHTGGQVVRSFVRQGVQPNTENTIVWDGRGDGGKQVPSGSYRFSVAPLSGKGSETTSDARFRFYQFKFPVRGHHTYGDGIGAGRHHQGQDVLADCGTPLVAARGGRVQWKETNASEAGGYGLVIDGTGTGRDYVYFHMRRKPAFHRSDRIRTGQRIGLVGQTGDATACHLHFEIWSPPGWYEGGHFTDPTDDLKRWDSWS